MERSVKAKYVRLNDLMVEQDTIEGAVYTVVDVVCVSASFSQESTADGQTGPDGSKSDLHIIFGSVTSTESLSPFSRALNEAMAAGPGTGARLAIIFVASRNALDTKNRPGSAMIRIEGYEA